MQETNQSCDGCIIDLNFTARSGFTLNWQLQNDGTDCFDLWFIHLGPSHRVLTRGKSERELVRRLHWIVPFGGTQHRHMREYMCEHPSGDSGRPVRLYRLESKQAFVDGCRRDKNSFRYKELSLRIVQVRLDTAPGLHLAPLITRCLTHIWEYTFIYIRVCKRHLHTGMLYFKLSTFTLITNHSHPVQDMIYWV